MRHSVLALLALACATPGTGDWPAIDDSNWEHLPSDQAAAPFDMTLTATPAIRGQDMTFTAEGAPLGTTVGFVLSTVGLGLEPCPPVLQGACMNLAPPTQLVSLVPNTPDGASFTITVPMSVPAGTMVWVQAGAPDGNDPHTSTPLEIVIDDDTDGDGVPDLQDICPDDAADDTDGDGICDSDDVCTGIDLSGDDDGDGVCNDIDQCPGVDDNADFSNIVDLPDENGIDDNCDGIDGDVDDAVFVDGSAAAGGDGSMAAPLNDLQAAIFQGAVQGKYIVIDRAPLVGPITLIDGVHLYGGYVANQGWLRDADEAAVITGGNPALSANDLNVPTMVDLLEFVSDDATGVGGTSYGATVIDSADNLTLSRVRITAGDGTPGRSGSQGASDASGFNGTDGEGGCDIDLFVVGGCASVPGAGGIRRVCDNGTTSGGRGTFDFSGDGGTGGNTGAGAPGRNGVAGSPGDFAAGAAPGGSAGIGGVGGAGGEQRTGCGFLGLGCCDEIDGTNGAHGSPGGRGADGADGTSGGNFGSVGFDDMYVPTTGTAGREGGSGGSGGGGGGGGGAGCDFTCCIADIGPAGGGGGSGGCGGAAGTLGTGGGGSFAVWSVDSSPVLDDVDLVTGRGGSGGDGGTGGSGGPGGPGGTGGDPFEFSGGGGNGGPGGEGGHGGNSGSGGGGPSVGLYSIGGTPTVIDVSYTLGMGGVGGFGPIPAPDGLVAETAP